MRRPALGRALYPTLLWTVMAVIALALISAGIIAAHLGAQHVVRQRTASMEQVARVIAPQALEVFRRSDDAAMSQQLAEALGEQAQCRVTIMRPDGVVIGDSERTRETLQLMDNHRTRPEIAEALHGRVGSSQRYSATIKTDLLYVAIPVRDSAKLIGILRVAIPLAEVAALRTAIGRAVAASLGLGFVVALPLTLWFARRMTGPIARMTDAAKSIAEGQLDVHAPPASITEVHQLGQALNAMGRSLQRHLTSLSTERNQARAILESMAEGVMALDERGRILLMNPAAGELLNVEAGHAQGRPLLETIRNQEVQELVRQASSTRSAATREFVMFQPGERIVKARAVPCETCQPEGPCTVVVLQDLTELQRYERLRRQFVANVTHELKSPLTAIQSLTETLRDGAVDDPSSNRRFIGLIDAEAGRLSRLIDDLLQLARIESGEAPAQLQPVDLGELARQLLPTFQAEASKRQVTVTLQLDGVPKARGDPDRFRQVFTNLIDNAIKYNRAGGSVTITAEAAPPFLRISVADTGIGIPDQDLPRIFERFYRVDKARSRELGGTGLGLSIVKHIVEAHGGQVSVTSQLELGSTFTVTLPLQT